MDNENDVVQEERNRERQAYHSKVASEKERKLKDMLSVKFDHGSNGNTSLQLDLAFAHQFFQRFRDRLYLGPFLKGLLALSERQIRMGNLIYWRIGSHLLTQTEDDYMRDAVIMMRKCLFLVADRIPGSVCLEEHISKEGEKSALRNGDEEDIFDDCYFISYDLNVSNSDLVKIIKLLRSEDKKLKHQKVKASGTLILDDLSVLRPRFDPFTSIVK